MFQIDKNIPIIDRNRKMGRPAVYPFDDMEVNDSFYVPNVTCKMRHSIQSQMAYRERVHKRKFISRKIDNGLRVWRVE